MEIDSTRELGRDVGLLVMRSMAGAMLVLGHGWPKLASFSSKAANFPDPLGISSSVSLSLAVGAEFFCGILLILGLATRLASIPLIVTMLVAAFIVHAGADFSKIEPAMLYLVLFITLLFTGPGAWSVDAWLDDRFGISDEV